LVVLKESNGDVSHEVTLVDKWIFDSNIPHTLSLSLESFDWICGIGNDAKLAGFDIGFEFKGYEHHKRLPK